MVFYMFLEPDANGRCYLLHLAQAQHVIGDFNSGLADIFKKIWINLLKTYDGRKGIRWMWQSLDSISIKSPLGGR